MRHCSPACSSQNDFADLDNAVHGRAAFAVGVPKLPARSGLHSAVGNNKIGIMNDRFIQFLLVGTVRSDGRDVSAGPDVLPLQERGGACRCGDDQTAARGNLRG